MIRAPERQSRTKSNMEKKILLILLFYLSIVNRSYYGCSNSPKAQKLQLKKNKIK